MLSPSLYMVAKNGASAFHGVHVFHKVKYKRAQLILRIPFAMNFHVYHLTVKFKPANYFSNAKVKCNCKQLAPQIFPVVIIHNYSTNQNKFTLYFTRPSFAH